jgi:hypothetical protein
MPNLLRVLKAVNVKSVIDWLLAFDDEIYFQARPEGRRRSEVAVCVANLCPELIAREV